MTEFTEALMIVWGVVTTDHVRSARQGDREARDRYERLLSAVIEAYPDEVGLFFPGAAR